MTSGRQLTAKCLKKSYLRVDAIVVSRVATSFVLTDARLDVFDVADLEHDEIDVDDRDASVTTTFN